MAFKPRQMDKVQLYDVGKRQRSSSIKIFRMKTISLVLLALFPMSALAQPVNLHSGIAKCTIDPQTLAVRLESGTTKRVLSLPGEKLVVTQLKIGADRLDFVVPTKALRVSFKLNADSLEVDFDSSQDATIKWPSVDFGQSNLILPFQDGRFIPFDAQNWWKYLQQSEFDTMESLSMPFFARNDTSGTVTWIFQQPHRNLINFVGHSATVTHSFVHLKSQQPYKVRVSFSNDPDPMQGAKVYRKVALKNAQLVPLAVRARSNPNLNRLPGALHAYLWGNGFIGTQDVKAWHPFVVALAKEPMMASLRGHFNADVHQVLVVAASQDYVDNYQKSILLMGLNEALSALPAAKRNQHLAILQRFLKSGAHGEGVSVPLLQGLQKLGVKKARLVLTDARDGELHPEVATAADQLGYLYGAYDSFHTIQDPRKKGTDESWSTAQFPGNLFDTSAMRKANGQFYSGFQNRGRVPNPIVLWPAVQARIKQNLKVPYNSYFIDAEAAGQYYDDYSPAHLLSAEGDVVARQKRLKWIANHHLVLGSEKVVPPFVGLVDVAEGAASYPFEWEDKDLKDKKSAYYIGAYWPPTAPTAFFKTVPLKPIFFEREYDPRFKLPLYEFVYHDYVVPTDHWSTPIYKFVGTQPTRLLTHMLYQSAPIYHLNRDTLAHPDLLKGYLPWSALNERLGFTAMKSFRYLNASRTVQETVFGDTTITANYSTTVYGKIPGLSLQMLRRGKTQIVTP